MIKKINLKFLLALFFFLVISFYIHKFGFSQIKDLEFNLDVNSKTTELPSVFLPNIDLSGRGYHTEVSWPYHLANKEAISRWQSEIGFARGFFRLYFNLWEIEAVKDDAVLQNTIFFNYEKIIKIISDAGGKVILVLYGIPAGWGRVLDKRSVPLELKNWQNYIRRIIYYFSVEKKYNIWYEVWSSPDSEDFFLGTKMDYLNLYEATAKVIKELENKNKLHIPIGGPGTSSWFQNINGNTIFSAEKSLIYELIKFCSQRKLPLDFISWHAFSDDPLIEKELTIYNKYPAELIRNWLKYFHMDDNIPLIISEWNYDSGLNWSEERSEKSYLTASFIPHRLKSMWEAGINYQVYFCLEDFQNNREGLNINRGIFSYSIDTAYSSNAKSIYNLFLFLSSLGNKFYGCFSLDEFLQVLATRKNGDIIILVSNYIDSHLGRNYIFRHISLLNERDRKILIRLFRSLDLEKLINGSLDLKNFSLSERFKSLLNKAKQLQNKVMLFKDKKRYLKLNLTNLKGTYLYQRYSISKLCVWDCNFLPAEEKIISCTEGYQEDLEINPYSVELIILKKEETTP